MKKRVIIIEDNLELADNTKYLLESEGYEVCHISDTAENLENILYEKSPSLILLDIYLKDNNNGIEIANIVRSKFHIPLVFFTSLADKATLEKVKEVTPEGYIVKPFSKDTLLTTVSIAISNFEIKSQEKVTELLMHEKIINGSIFIRDKGYLKKISINDIEWIKADGSYTHISTSSNSVFTLRNILKDVLNKLPSRLFCKEVTSIRRVPRIISG